MIRLENFGAETNDPNHDCTPALEAMMDFYKYRDCLDLTLSRGIYHFLTPPKDISSTLRIKGVSRYDTVLMREYSVTDPKESFLSFREVEGEETTRESSLEDLSVVSGPTSHGGCLVSFSTDGPVTGWARMRSVKISHNNLGGGYYRGLVVDGRKNMKPGGQGHRDLRFEDVFIFKSTETYQSVALFNVTNPKLDIWASGDVVISGGSDPLQRSTYGRISLVCLGALIYQNCSMFESYGSAERVVFNSLASQCRHYGRAGSVANLSGDDSNIVI